MSASPVGPFAAFVGGVLSFASPCILPMVPVYISIITGYSVSELKERNFSLAEMVLPLSLFIAGFTLSFVFLGATATTLGDFLNRNYYFFKKLVGLFLILWGFMLATSFKVSFLNRTFAINKGKGGSALGIFIMGVAFGLSWSPCVGAVLVPILSLAALKSTVISGMFLLFCYSMGIAVPLVIVCVAFAKAMSLFGSIQPHYRKIEIATGIIIAAFGAYLLL